MQGFRFFTSSEISSQRIVCIERTGRYSVAAALTLVAVGCLVLPHLVRAAPAGSWPEGPSACSLVTTRSLPPSGPNGVMPPQGLPPSHLDAWIQCNFSPSRLEFTLNREVRRAKSPTLYGADEYDALACRQTRKGRAICQGSIDSDVRAQVPLVVSPDACAKRRVKLSVSAIGGVDCEADQLCPEIGLLAETRWSGRLC